MCNVWFKFHLAWEGPIKLLNDAEKASLLMAILAMERGETPEPPVGNAVFVLAMIEDQIKRDQEEYAAGQETKRKNGSKGGRPPKTEENLQDFEETEKTEENLKNLPVSEKTEKTYRFSKKPKKPEEDKEKEKEEETEEDKDLEEDKEREGGEAPPAPPKRTRFAPPTVDEVDKYCRERGNKVNAQHFVDFYAAKGWKVGSQPMKDWQAAVRTWEQRDDRQPARAAPKVVTQAQYTQRPHKDGQALPDANTAKAYGFDADLNAFMAGFGRPR